MELTAAPITGRAASRIARKIRKLRIKDDEKTVATLRQPSGGPDRLAGWRRNASRPVGVSPRFGYTN